MRLIMLSLSGAYDIIPAHVSEYVEISSVIGKLDTLGILNPFREGNFLFFLREY